MVIKLHKTISKGDQEWVRKVIKLMNGKTGEKLFGYTILTGEGKTEYKKCL